LEYFTRALYLDLSDSHGNTADGVHVANAGGVWAGVVHGFAGMVEQGNHIEFTPRLPSCWESVRFRLRRHGSKMQIDVDPHGLTLTVLSGSGVPVRTGGDVILVTVDEPLRIGR
jgi:alpha,alpha-trehalose phosphorylase